MSSIFLVYVFAVFYIGEIAVSGFFGCCCSEYLLCGHKETHNNVQKCGGLTSEKDHILRGIRKHISWVSFNFITIIGFENKYRSLVVNCKIYFLNKLSHFRYD